MADVNIRTDEECFDCELCEISFTTSKALKQHMTTHPGDKHFMCDLCAQSFGRFDHLKRHFKRKHADKIATASMENPMQRSKSFVWNYFEKLTCESAQCKLCAEIVDTTQRGHALVAHTHLRTKHPDVTVIDPAANTPLELSSCSGDLQEDVGSTVTEYSMLRRNRSKVWNHFVKLSDESAKCGICDKILQIPRGNTSGALTHLHSVHPAVMVSDSMSVSQYQESELSSSSNNLQVHSSTEAEYSMLCKNRSDVWNFFEKLTAFLAKCMLCDKELPATTDTTSALHVHLQAKHRYVTMNDSGSRQHPEQSSCSSDLQIRNETETKDSVERRKVFQIQYFFVKVEDGSVKCKLCDQILETSGCSAGPAEACDHLRRKHLVLTVLDPAVSSRSKSELDSSSCDLEEICETETEYLTSHKYKSEIWNYFVKVTADMSKCMLCNKLVATTRGCTSGAINHLQRKHQTVKMTGRAVNMPSNLLSCVNDFQESLKTKTEYSAQRRNRSEVWNHFVRITGNTSKCKHCDKVMQTVEGDTSAAQKHLQCRHFQVTMNYPALDLQADSCSNDLQDHTKTEREDLVPPKKRFRIWNHFLKVTRNLAKCKHCNKLKWTKGGSTSSARHHFLSKHRDVVLTEIKVDPQPVSELSDSGDLDLDEHITMTTTDETTLHKDESDVWNYFLRVTSDLAICSLCDNEVPTIGGTASVLCHHLQTRHRHVCSLAVESGPHPSSGMELRCPCPNQHKETSSNLIIDFLAENLLPIEISESKSFTHLLESWEPNGTVPCSKTVMARMFARKNELIVKIKDDMAKKANDVSVTTEVWRCRSDETYMSFTATYITTDWIVRNVMLESFVLHEDHTLEKVSNELTRIAAEWGIDKKLVACVHDGAINVDVTSIRNDWVDICCAAHVVHLCVTAAMGINETEKKPILRLIRSASRLVTYFNDSPLATAELLKRQNEMKPNKRGETLIQHCSTRWNSVYDMFKRLVELRWSIVAVLSDRDITNPADAKNLDLEEDWNLMKRLLSTMEPLQVVTALLSSETSPSISVCIPMLWGLINNHLAITATDDNVLREFKTDVTTELARQFPLSVDSVEHPLVVASVLDPAYKRLKTFPDDVRQAAYLLVRALAASVTLPVEDRLEDENYSNDTKPTMAAKRQRTGLEYILGNIYDDPAVSTTSDAEVDRYLQSDSLTDSRGDVVDWWKRNAMKFPRLAVLARRYLAISPTSIESERLLCLSGQVNKKTRSRLPPEIATCLVFLKKNLRAFDK